MVSALMDLTPIVSGMDLMVVVEEDGKGEEEEMEMEAVAEEVVKDPLEELEVLVVLVESDLPDLTPTVCGRKYRGHQVLFLTEIQISGTGPGVATRRTGPGENRKTIIEGQERGKLAKPRD